MKIFTSEIKAVAQGEIYMRRICKLPDGLKKVESENGFFIIGHSETGHHHVVEKSKNIQWFSSDDPMITYLQVIEATDETETVLKHLRTFDTHEPIKFDPGIYEIRNGREATPEGWRKTVD